MMSFSDMIAQNHAAHREPVTAIRHRLSLPDYLAALQAVGKVTFTREEALAALPLTARGFRAAVAREEKRSALISPCRGFYVVVPPQYQLWGAPPPSWYIDQLMRHIGRPYYVGVLKAAELHGASHQAVMAYQVVTDRILPMMRLGRSMISFCYRRDINAVANAVLDWKTDTGTMKLASRELTAFDLLRYPQAAGGVDMIATALADLGPGLAAGPLAALAPAFERAVVQRLGYLLDDVGAGDGSIALSRYLEGQRHVAWVELDPTARAVGRPLERNRRWKVVVRRRPETDQ